MHEDANVHTARRSSLVFFPFLFLPFLSYALSLSRQSDNKGLDFHIRWRWRLKGKVFGARWGGRVGGVSCARIVIPGVKGAQEGRDVNGGMEGKWRKWCYFILNIFYLDSLRAVRGSANSLLRWRQIKSLCSLTWSNNIFKIRGGRRISRFGQWANRGKKWRTMHPVMRKGREWERGSVWGGHVSLFFFPLAKVAARWSWCRRR
jgi:hypothetical protein